MLNIEKMEDGTKLTVALIGRLDTTTAPTLEEALKEDLTDVTELTLDLANLDYISSAGLRVLLSAQKTMMRKGSMVVTNVSEEVGEIFEVTGFMDILTIR